MIKKMLIIGALIAGIVFLLNTPAWFFLPMGSSKIGSGLNSAWNAFSWSRMLFSGLTWLVFWSLPALLAAWLVSLLLQPASSQKIDQSS